MSSSKQQDAALRADGSAAVEPAVGPSLEGQQEAVLQQLAKLEAESGGDREQARHVLLEQLQGLHAARRRLASSA